MSNLGKTGRRGVSSFKPVRPTSAKVREALFNILQESVRGSIFLDLYAGTGAVGIDALLRGAAEAFFVEASRSCSRNIQKLIAQKGLTSRSRVVMKRARPFLEWAEREKLEFHIVFLDPPYHTDEAHTVLAAIGSSCILGKGALVIAEHFKKRDLAVQYGRLRKIRDYVYGDSILSMYRVS